MFIHNLDPVLIDFGFISIRWYSLAYIFGIIDWMVVWKKNNTQHIFISNNYKFDLKILMI